MKLGKAFLWGLPIIVAIGILKWLGDTFFGLWEPFLEIFHLSPAIEWALGFVLTVVAIIIIGYIIEITVPIRKVFKKNKIIQILKKNGSKPVVLVEYAGDLALGLVTEYNPQSEIYEILLLSVPIPVTGQIIFARAEKVQVTGLTTTDLMNQLTSLGFRPILQSLRQDFLDFFKRQGHS